MTEKIKINGQSFYRVMQEVLSLLCTKVDYLDPSTGQLSTTPFRTPPFTMLTLLTKSNLVSSHFVKVFSYPFIKSISFINKSPAVVAELQDSYAPFCNNDELIIPLYMNNKLCQVWQEKKN